MTAYGKCRNYGSKLILECTATSSHHCHLALERSVKFSNYTVGQVTDSTEFIFIIFLTARTRYPVVNYQPATILPRYLTRILYPPLQIYLSTSSRPTFM